MFLYVAEAGSYLKVGWTKDPERRLRDIQTNCPLPMHFLVVVRAASEHEARRWEVECHDALDPWRVRGEWFRLPPYAELRFLEWVSGFEARQQLPSEPDLWCPILDPTSSLGPT